MRIFLSHISEEQDVAVKLKKWFLKVLGPRCEVFVSSDGDSIKLGTRWLETITTSISESDVLVVLCSSTSINRPWVNFEAGCGWSFKKPIIPLCYRGLKTGQLPPPLNYLQGVNLDERLPEALLNSICAHTGANSADHSKLEGMYEELSETVESLRSTDLITEDKKDDDGRELSEDEISILLALAREAPQAAVLCATIARGIGISDTKAKYYLKQLLRMNFVTSYSGDYYSIVDPGLEYLLKHGFDF